MRSEDEIMKRIEWTKKAINDKDCDTTFMQVKLYAQLEILEWTLQEDNQ
jgi:hypothetical protein